MNPFDLYFPRLREYEDDLLKGGRSVHAWRYASLDAAESDWIGTLNGIILKDDTALELGGPATAGSTFILWTDDISLIEDGMITLAGLDIRQTENGHLPFGQVVMLGGPTLGRDAQPKLERALHIAERVPGYMVRSTGGRIWARVSRQAMCAGFSFKVLGSRILENLYSTAPGVTAAEILFVTSSADDVSALERIGSQVRKLAHDLRRERLRETADGAYECENEVSCEACPDNEVCSEIREMIVIRKREA
jgi:CO dehydrogenase/acetyl-CoA synthase beta subunit